MSALVAITAGALALAGLILATMLGIAGKHSAPSPSGFSVDCLECRTVLRFADREDAETWAAIHGDLLGHVVLVNESESQETSRG